jgi:hypothetical protein
MTETRCPRCIHDERIRNVLQPSTSELYPPDHMPECRVAAPAVVSPPAVDPTDEDRADREATERDHSRGDHTYCGITCETELPTEQLRNFVVAKGYPGTAGALDELLRRAREESRRVTPPPAAWLATQRGRPPALEQP